MTMEKHTSHQAEYQPILDREAPCPPLPPRPMYIEKQNPNPTMTKIANPISSLIHKLSPPPLEEESQRAAKVLRKLCGGDSHAQPSSTTPLSSIPHSVIANAKGLVIFTVARASGLASLAHGSGVLLARTHTGTWSSPSAILVNSLGMGAMAGVEIYKCVLVINTFSALQSFQRTRVSLGGDIAVAAGPWGAGSRGEVEKDVYSYIISKKGLYFGAQMDGTVISARQDENARFYSERVAVGRILEGDVGRWTVLHDTLSEIDLKVSWEQEGFNEKSAGGYGTIAPQKAFPVIMEFDDRRGQIKGTDGIWRPQHQPHHQTRPTRLSLEEWKRGKVYSGIFDTDKDAVYDHSKAENNQELLEPNPAKLALMRGALGGVPSVSSKEDLYGAHEKKVKALGSKVLANSEPVGKPVLGEKMALGSKREDEKRVRFHDLTYRTGFSAATSRKSKKEEKNEVKEEDEDSEWEDERLFYDLNSRSGVIGGREEWEDERFFYVEKPVSRTNGEDERGFYTIAQLDDGRARRGVERETKKEDVGSKRDAIWVRGDRYA